MRRELAEYEKNNPKTKVNRLLSDFYEKAEMALFDIRISSARLGSPAWHNLQERLSRKSSVKKNLLLRARFYEKTLPACGRYPVIHPGVILQFPHNVRFADDVFINRGVIITAPAPVSIGSNVLIGPYTIINSGNHNYKDKNILVRKQGHKELPIIIEDDVWIGAHVSIMPGVTIGKGAVIGANSVITKSVETYAVVVGIPANPISFRI